MKDIEICGITSGIRLGEFSFSKITNQLKVGAGSLAEDDLEETSEAPKDETGEGSDANE